MVKFQNRMPKQVSTISEEINEEAKKQAITWQVKALTDKANRELHRPKRPPPKCHFCESAHYSSECQVVSNKKKAKLVESKRLCQICLNKGNHHPASCRTLRQPNQLCQRRKCKNRFDIHHTSLCKEEVDAEFAEQGQAEMNEEIVN
ncbi:hypothetical protein B9Z55_015516 [Caenorhabditis nigoni]|uniref:Uncharacterized protein n=1 Tax=Caenorhabditis nigoni TaxID=1611254 RepID=A0A2G5UAK3_9PELO|nr:hypothetical protein B9Z55_015516 [Caenorhabditis nigoni]